MATQEFIGRLKDLPAADGIDLCAEVVVRTPGVDAIQYQGTRAALEAEGVIPDDMEWPKGFTQLRWEDESYRYRLTRRRPEGVKGPRKDFLTVDWWAIHFSPKRAREFMARRIELKVQEMQELVYQASKEGRAERNQHWHRYFAAKNDERFQAAMASIPGVLPPARRRRTT